VQGTSNFELRIWTESECTAGGLHNGVITIAAESSCGLSLLERLMNALEILDKPQRLAPARLVIGSTEQ